MKNITKKQIAAAANAAHLWESLSDESVFHARYGRTIADWEYLLNLAITCNRIAIGGK
jgi:hypothetical protein